MSTTFLIASSLNLNLVLQIEGIPPGAGGPTPTPETLVDVGEIMPGNERDNQLWQFVKGPEMGPNDVYGQDLGGFAQTFYLQNPHSGLVLNVRGPFDPNASPTKTDQVPSPLPKQRRSPVGTLVDVYEKRDQVWDLNQLWVAVPADGNGVPPNPCYLICNAQSYAGRLGRMGPPGKGEGIAPGICEGLVLNIAEGRRGLISVGSGSQVDIFPQELTDGKQCPVGSGKEGNNQFWLFTDENMTPFPCPYSV